MSNCKIIQDGKTQYVLLVPEKKDVFIDFAIKTLNEALQQSTGVSLPVKTQAESKFISLGNTYALQSLTNKLTYGKDGLAVQEVAGNLYLYGESDYGPIWAVYEFLERTIGYRFFALDEIKIEKRTEIDGTGMNVSYTPTFSNRCSWYRLSDDDLAYSTGLKTYAWYGIRLDGEEFWGAWAHNHVSEFLHPKTYYKDHPEWYYQEENFRTEDPEKMQTQHMQLCLSNMEMRDEFFNRLVERIKERPRATHFMLGHEDNRSFCQCERCQKIVKKIGTSGLQMDFINDMARRTEKWRKENAPKRMIYVGGLAYETENGFYPPVKKENGVYVPVDPCVVAEENVFMFFCPIYAPEHSRSVYCEANKTLRDILEKWKTVCNRYAVQLYYGSFRIAFEFVDGIYRIKEDIGFYKELGVDSFYMESNTNRYALAFQKMTLYVLTRLEWDKSLDTDDLIKEFCENYYKVASPYLLEYFYYMMDYYAKTRKRIEYLTGKKYAYGMCLLDTVPQGFWSLNAVYDASLILDKAEESVKSADYSAEMKEKLLDRIEAERMPLFHIQLEYYNKETSAYDEMRTINTFPKEKVLELCDRVERFVRKFGVKHINGDGTALETIEGWRQRAIKNPRFWEERIYREREKFNNVGKDE